MNGETLFSHIGDIDEQLLDRYEQMGLQNKAKHAPSRLLRWSIAIAACLLIAAGSAFLLWPKQQSWPPKYLVVSSGSSSSDATRVPRWEELTTVDRFPELDFENHNYTRRNTKVPPEKIGEKRGDVTMTGIDFYTEETHYMNATVYTVKEYATDCVAAVQFEGSEDYYIYVNSYYQPETLGQFIEDLNLRDTLEFGSAWYSYEKRNGAYASVEFVNLDPAVIWEMLLSDLDMLAIKDYDQHFFAGREMSISINIKPLGYENISLSVTSDGYLTTNILDTGKGFYLGKEKVDSFVNYVLENCEGYEIIHQYSDPVPSSVEENTAAGAADASRLPA